MGGRGLGLCGACGNCAWCSGARACALGALGPAQKLPLPGRLPLTPPLSATPRYAAQAQKSDKSEWAKAEGYYRAAAALCPGNGHPCNQLAVMAYYTGEELRAVYYYFRCGVAWCCVWGVGCGRQALRSASAAPLLPVLSAACRCPVWLSVPLPLRVTS